MSAAHTTAGSAIAIGPVVEDVRAFDVAAAETADTSFVAIRKLMDLGEIGDTATDVPVTFIDCDDPDAPPRTVHQKGSFDGGQTTLTFARDWTDNGQKAVRAAFRQDQDFMFRIRRKGAGGKVSYFAGQVMGVREQYSNADSVQQIVVTIGINTEIFTIEDA